MAQTTVAAMPAVDFDVATEVASHEALIRQTYKDSVGVLTWCVYTINFTTAMSDANFAIVATVNGTGFPSPAVTVTGRTATSVTISTGGSSAGSAAAGDATDINLVVFR